jgi:uncharacterized protein (TIGR03067 family)
MRLSVAAWIVLVIASAPARAQQAEVKGDLAKLQGRWAGLTKLARGGSIVSHLEIKGDRVTAWIGSIKDVDVPDGPGGKKVEKARTESRVILDETTSPKRIQFVEGKIIDPDPNSLAAKIKPPDTKGVYELDGDTLKMASNPLSDKFPAKVAAGAQTVLVLYARGDVPPADVDASGMPARGGARGKPAASGKPAAKGALKGDLAALQGTWTAAEGVFHGHGRETMTIQGDAIDVVGRANNGIELHFRARIKLNEAASPRAIDFVDVTNGNRRGQPSVGIYELDGDMLKLHRSGLGKPRSAVFQDGSQNGLVANWARGTIALKGEPTAPGGSVGRAREVDFVGEKLEGREFQGATVVKFSPRTTVFQVADGRTFEGAIVGAKGFDIDGTPKGRGDELLKPGNVVDVLIVPNPRSKVGIQEVLEFHLVRVGDGPPPAANPPKPRPAPAPAQPTERVTDKEYRGAVILDVQRNAVVLSVDGKKVTIATTDKNTRAFDSNGRQLNMFTQSWVLVKGNTVDVVLEKPRARKGSLPAIIEIRLVKGKLKDVPHYLDDKPGAR